EICEALHSFPTRRASDRSRRYGVGWSPRERRRGARIGGGRYGVERQEVGTDVVSRETATLGRGLPMPLDRTAHPSANTVFHVKPDRKSTRLNSSHVSISY